MKTILSELTVELLAKKVELPPNILLELVDDSPYLYTEQSIPKKSGDTRILEIPYAILKNFQKILLNKILHKIPTHPKLFGRPGTSIKDAVSDHVKKATVIRMDIKNFFPTTKAYIIKKAFIRNGATAEIANILTRLVSHKNHLPQGAPTSPCIGRIVLQPIAEEIEGYLSNIPKSSFSIYVDDIILSGPMGIKRLQNPILNILKRHGYEINKSKIHLMNRDTEQVSLNIKLNKGIEATDEYLREIERLEIQLPPNHPTLKGKKSFLRFLMK